MNGSLETRIRDVLLIILFCGTVWGCVEAGLGLLPKYPFSSVLPTVIGFMVLALARAYLPKPGSSTAIGTIAMLYRVKLRWPPFCLWQKSRLGNGVFNKFNTFTFTFLVNFYSYHIYAP